MNDTKRTRLTDWALQEIHRNPAARKAVESTTGKVENTVKAWVKTNDPQLSHPDVTEALAKVLNVPQNTLVNKIKS